MKARLQRKQTGSRCGETSPLSDELDLSTLCSFNPFTAMLARAVARKMGNKSAKFEIVKVLWPLSMSTRKDFYKNAHIEIRFVIGPLNTLFDGVYVCTFQPGNLTCWGREGVTLVG